MLSNFDRIKSNITVDTLLSSIDPLTNTLYVAKNGNDSTGNGSIAKPYLTIQYAINISSPDADNRYAIIIMPGVYTEQVTLKAFSYLISYIPNTVYIEYDGDAIIAPTAMNYYESILYNINTETLSTDNNYVALRVQAKGSVYAFNLNVVSQVTGIIVEGDGFLYNDLGGVLTSEDGVTIKDTAFYVAKNFDFTAGGSPHYDLESEAGTIVLLNNSCYYANSRTNLLGTTLYIGNSTFVENKSDVTGTTVTDALNTVDGILNGGVSGSFTTVDSKTVTVTDGIITAITA